ATPTTPGGAAAARPRSTSTTTPWPPSATWWRAWTPTSWPGCAAGRAATARRPTSPPRGPGPTTPTSGRRSEPFRVPSSAQPLRRPPLADALARLASWLRPKAMPAALGGPQWTGTSFVDSYRRHRNPTPNELLAELRNTAWACASLNAGACASFPPRLYV